MPESKYPWLNRAMDPDTPLYNGESTIKTMTSEVDGEFWLYPTIRMIEGELVELDPEAAFQMAKDKEDYVILTSQEEADSFSKYLSGLIQKRRGMAEGGLVPDMDEQTEMAFMAEDENVDPVSGNEIPPGSTAKEVRDDVPVRLSEGEFVIPANVVKYFGVKYFYDLIRKGEEGMAKELDDLPFDVSELQYEEEQPQT